MKQHDIHNDEALYQQMLAELTPGAGEFDRLMAEGKQPAASQRRTIPLYKNVAAACVLLAVAGGTWFWQTGNEDEQQTQLVALVVDEKQESAVAYYQAKRNSQTETATTSLDAPKQVCQTGHHASRPIPTEQTAQPAEDSIKTSADEPDEELCLALLAEVEARETQIEQQEKQSMRDLIDELIYNIEQQPNRPELSL